MLKFLDKMKVKWREARDIPASYWNTAEIEEVTMFKHYSGEVIGTNKSWGTTYLVVACRDKKVREINIDYVEVIDEG